MTGTRFGVARLLLKKEAQAEAGARGRQKSSM